MRLSSSMRRGWPGRRRAGWVGSSQLAWLSSPRYVTREDESGGSVQVGAGDTGSQVDDALDGWHGVLHGPAQDPARHRGRR